MFAAVFLGVVYGFLWGNFGGLAAWWVCSYFISPKLAWGILFVHCLVSVVCIVVSSREIETPRGNDYSDFAGNLLLQLTGVAFFLVYLTPFSDSPLVDLPLVDPMVTVGRSEFYRLFVIY